MSVQFAEIQDQLLTIDDVREKLSVTEPLTSFTLSNGNKTSFRYGDDWALQLDHLKGTDPVEVYVTIDGAESQLTKDAALQATSAFGLQSTYVKKTPARLVEEHTNYWYGLGMGDREFSVLRAGSDNRIAAFSKPSITPFSNALLLDNILEGAQREYGSDVYADYKFRHDLNQTDVRLILPDFTRNIHDTQVDGDVWSAGIHLTNSLTGGTPTTVEGYLFRWWCTNGATTVNGDIGKWNRRIMGQQEDVYSWARDAVDEILGGMEEQFDAVQSLTQLNIAGNVTDILADIFSTYGVPVSQRQGVIDALLESESLTLYEVMQAITRLANDPDLKPERVDRLLRTGGAIPSAIFDPLKAKVWREGHAAGDDVPNPYEIQHI